ncbi:MAG: ABC transporter permease [Clostridiales bacterium]|nr:ABC transporter permease [Clostridiales bacterium]
MKRLTKLRLSPAYSGFLLMMISLVAYIILRGPAAFFNINNLASLFKNYTPIILVTMAQAFLMFMGYIDISIGAQLSFANVLAVNLPTMLGVPVWLGWLLALVLTMLLASLNGLIISYLRIPALLESFAMIFVIRGINLAIQPKPGGHVDPAINRAYDRLLFGFLPTSVVILAVALLVWMLLKRTTLVNHLFAIGANERNAYASGINTIRTKVLTYAIAGLFTGVAGLCYTAAYATGNPITGEIYGLQSISACIIGGVPMAGGFGTVFSALFGISFQIFVKDSVVQVFKMLPGVYTTYWHNLFTDFIILVGLVAAIFFVRRQDKHRLAEVSAMLEKRGND